VTQLELLEDNANTPHRDLNCSSPVIQSTAWSPDWLSYTNSFQAGERNWRL